MSWGSMQPRGVIDMTGDDELVTDQQARDLIRQLREIRYRDAVCCLKHRDVTFLAWWLSALIPICCAVEEGKMVDEA